MKSTSEKLDETIKTIKNMVYGFKEAPIFNDVIELLEIAKKNHDMDKPISHLLASIVTKFHNSIVENEFTNNVSDYESRELLRTMLRLSGVLREIEEKKYKDNPDKMKEVGTIDYIMVNYILDNLKKFTISLDDFMNSFSKNDMLSSETFIIILSALNDYVITANQELGRTTKKPFGEHSLRDMKTINVVPS